MIQLVRYIYLASPYIDPDPEVRERRYFANKHAYEFLTCKGEVVFSPIVHCHLSHTTNALPGGWDFWEKVDLCFLFHAREMRILMLPGWQESVGVTAEAKFCAEQHIPVTYMEPLE